MASIYHGKPGIHRAAELKFIRTVYDGTVWYRFEADGELVASVFCEELPPIVVVRSSPIEE